MIGTTKNEIIDADGLFGNNNKNRQQYYRVLLSN